MATKVLEDAIGRGLHSARPSDNNSNALTGTIGRLYYETDTNQLYRDNGTSWDRVILKLGDSGDYFPLGEADGDILVKVSGGWANSPTDQVAVSAWGAAEADVDMGSNQITNLGAPSGANDAARKADIPTNLVDLDPASGDVDMGTHKIINVVDPTSNQHAATKKYVDDGLVVVAAAIPTNLTQLDPANGDVDLGTHKLINVVDPSSNQHAATKKYVDDQIAGVAATGSLSDLDPAEADLDIGGFLLTNVAIPTVDADAATKGYVDEQVSSFGSELGVIAAAGDLVVGAGSADVVDRTGGTTSGWASPTGIDGGTFPNDITDASDGTNVQFTPDAGGVIFTFDAGGPVHVNKATLSQDGPGDPSGRASWELLSSTDGVSWTQRLNVTSALISHTYDLDTPATAQYWQFHDTADTGTAWNIRHVGLSDAATPGTPIRKAIPTGAANKFLKVNGTEDGYIFDVPATPDGGAGTAVKDSFGLLKPSTKSSKVENIVVNSGDTTDLLTVTGGGTITAFTLITGGDGFDDEVATDVVLNIYVDGEGSPSISFDLGVFGTRFNPDKTVKSTLNIGVEAVTAAASALTAGVASGQLTFRFPIFFGESVRFEFDNQTDSNTLAFLNAFYTPGVTQNRRLRSASLTWADKVTRTPGGGDYEFLNVADGPGAIVWHSLAAQGATSPAFLEANVVAYVDGEGTASVQTSGTEDWFGDSFYWAAGRTGTPWSYLGNADIVSAFTVAAAIDLMAFCGGLSFTDGVRLVWELGGGFSDVDFSYLVLYYTGEDDLVASGGTIDYPTNASIDARELTLAAGDDESHYLEPHHYAEQDYGYEVIPISSNTTDPWGADTYLAAGTYLLTVTGIARENHGKFILKLDGTAFGAESDWYSASELLNVRLKEVVVVATGGLHRLDVLITGARAASFDQIWGLTRFWFRKTTLAEGTVFYGDTPVMYDGEVVVFGV